jgi:Uncharacterized conserved protein
MKFSTVDQYIQSFSPSMQSLLQEIRGVIREAAPKAEETISYNMPAFKQDGALVYYAANKEHIGFYPGDSTTTNLFANELRDYKTSKGAIQFPIDQPIPHKLVKKIVQHRIQENKEKAALRKKK